MSYCGIALSARGRALFYLDKWTSKVTWVVRINDNSAQGPSSAANLISTVLIANADASSIGILSDQRESKGLLLIANLELNFRVNPIGISELEFSNRKFLTISSSLFCAAHLKPQVMEFLIENARLRFGLTHTKSSSLQISNREWIAISQPAQSPTGLTSLVTRHLPLTTAVLIVTPRLEFPVIATKQKLNRISNRYKTHFLCPGCVSGMRSWDRGRFAGTVSRNTLTCRALTA